MMNLLLKGFKFSEPCDECLNEESFQLPKWYDVVKFKRCKIYIPNYLNLNLKIFLEVKSTLRKIDLASCSPSTLDFFLLPLIQKLQKFLINPL